MDKYLDIEDMYSDDMSFTKEEIKLMLASAAISYESENIVKEDKMEYKVFFRDDTGIVVKGADLYYYNREDDMIHFERKLDDGRIDVMVSIDRDEIKYIQKIYS